MAAKSKAQEASEAATPLKKARTDAGQLSEAKAGPGWVQVDSVFIRDYGSPAAARVAGFDMDSTLIKTKSGDTFAKSKDDWMMWAPEVVPKLRELAEAGHKIVILSNQGGVAKGKTKLADVQSKIDAMQQAMGVPLLAMLMTSEDVYRKPLPASWRLMASRFNGGVAVSTEKSFYCGDAAGRVPPVVKKKDFSASDLKFALNVGVAFHTPEEYFLGKPQAYEKQNFPLDPRTLGTSPKAFPVPALDRPTIVLCVGSPGSGKSFAATQHLTSCTRVNQDTLKKKEKCLQACKEALQAGKSAVVDNQNKTKADRAPYLALAKAQKAQVIALYYDVPKELCFHLNAYRLLNTKSALHRAEKVPSMIIHSFYKNFEEPKVAEGFAAVYRVGPEHFTAGSDADLDLLRSFMD